MVLQKLQLGKKVRLVTGSSYSGWHPNVLRILPLFIGVAALATTLLLGSFLWGFVSRRRNKKKAAIPTTTFEDFYSLPDSKLHTAISFRGFSKATPSFSLKVANYDNSAYFDEFDEEEDYEEELAETRSNVDPEQITSAFNSQYSSVQSWLAQSPDIHRPDFSIEEVEVVFARHPAKILHLHDKPAKSWKRLLFWRRAKKTNKFEFNLSGVHSNRTTPIHHMFKSSRTRATVAPSFTSIPAKRASTPERPSSGPLYYDGTPNTPNRNIRPFSSPRSACATPSRDGLYESTYKPLQRSYGSYRTCPSPLYIP